jgi:hypothetical protein
VIAPLAPTPKPTPSAAAATPKPAPSAIIVAMKTETPAPAPAPKPAPPAVVLIPSPLPAGTPGPDIDSDGDETTASVPISGSTAGMVHYSLLRHKGVAVNLPRAQSELPIGLHSVGRDGLRYVWIRQRPEGGIQVRFIFGNPSPEERLLEVEDDTVRIRVRVHSDVARTTDEPETMVAGTATEP